MLDARCARAGEAVVRAFALAALLLIVLSVFGQISPQNAAQRAKELQKQLDSQRAKRHRLRSELARTEKRIHVVASDMKWVDNRLEELESDLAETATSLAQSRLRQKRLAVELQRTTEELATVTDQTRQRLRRIYMRGSSSFLSVVAGTEGAGDVVSRKVLMNSIEKQDHRLFESVKRLRAEVSRKKLEQDRTVAAITRYESKQKSQQEDLNDARDEKQEMLGDLHRQRDAERALVKQFEEDERAIASQIAEFLRKARAGTIPSVKLPTFTGRFSRPVSAPITSGFGSRYHPILKIRRPHEGIDFGARSGTPIGAAADGIVIASTYLRGYGNTVILDHGGGYQTLYGHCSRSFVTAGQHVKRGEHIATVGATGLASGPHLHFEVRINGRAVNPLGKL